MVIAAMRHGKSGTKQHIHPGNEQVGRDRANVPRYVAAHNKPEPPARVRFSGSEFMAKKRDDNTVIKKYANRRLYNTGTSTYVTLEDLAAMVKRDEDFTVQDARSGEDITHSVLTQIIFELENKDGHNMLPVPFLRQLIAFYGDQMQMVVPSFLEQSMIAFGKEQGRIKEQMDAAFTGSPIDMMSNMHVPLRVIEEHTKRNMELFQNAMRVFTPGMAAAPATDDVPDAATEGTGTGNGELGELKQQIAAMQAKLETLGKK
jgi:polyhydroxyalkanoate synthesis repressor PhaR